MKLIIRKAYWSYEKEEAWLNEMSGKGLALCDYSWCKYTFDDAEKGEYIYRIELLDKTVDHEKSRKYIEFVESTGAEFVASYMRWVYFRKKAADGPFDLFSDIDSKIKHNTRIYVFWLMLAVMEFSVVTLNFVMGFLYNLTLHLILSVPLALFGVLFLSISLRSLCKLRTLKKERRVRE